MLKQDKAFVEQTKRWLETQENSIESCRISIGHAQDLIKHNRKIIALETGEIRAKQKARDEVQKNLELFIKDRS